MAKTEAAPATEQTPDAAKARGQRSPLYPFITLEKAVERAKTLYDVIKKGPSRAVTVVGAWNYGPKSSGGLQTIAALKQFGMLADQGVGEGRRLALTELGLRLALGSEEAAHREAMQRAALNPTIHSELWSKWERELPGDAVIRDYLVFDRKFNPTGAKELIREYRDTLAFSGLIDCGMDSFSGEDKPGEEVPPMDAPPITQASRTPIGKPPTPPVSGEHERLRFSLSGGRTVRLIFAGPEPTQAEIDDLMDYLKISRRTFPATTPPTDDPE